MRYVVVANGEMGDPVAEMRRWVREGDVLVAADGGTRYVLAAGLTPHHVVGDLDSLTAAQREQLAAAGMELHPHPPAKDETDLELALLWAAQQAPDAEIVILGALGGRPDQALANLLLLALPELAGHRVWLVAGAWQISLVRSGETLCLRGTPGDRLSLIPMGGDAAGITTEGLRYPLRAETLYFGLARGVSNVFAHTEARVYVEQGRIWCFHEVRMENLEL